MKKLLKAVLLHFGYSITKVSNEGSPLALYYEQYERDSIEKKFFFNIGAGSFQHPAWTNIDNDSDWYKVNRKIIKKGIQFDLLSLEKMPLEDNIAEVIYTSHTVEHITDLAAQNMFNEAYRILKKGGIFRVTTPNIELDYQAYKSRDRHYYYTSNQFSNLKEMKRIGLMMPMNKASIEQLFLHHFASCLSTIVNEKDGAKKRIGDEELNKIFHNNSMEEALDYITSLCPIELQKKNPGNHINWWNKKKMFQMLKVAGFINIYLSAYGQSYCPILRDTVYFDNTHPKISLYVEAKK